jgi:hypothetical protein
MGQNLVLAEVHMVIVILRIDNSNQGGEARRY